jgi:hypothetical protein
LHIAQQQRFQHLVIIVKLRVRINLHTGFTLQLSVYPVRQQRRGLTLWVAGCVRHMAELDNNLAQLTFGKGGGRGQGSDDG